MRKRVAQIIWLTVLVMLLSIMGALLFCGGIRLYLAPRLVSVSWFGFFVLLILSVYQVVMLFRPQVSTHVHASGWYALIFAIPILFMLLAMPDENTPQALPKQNAVLPGVQEQATISIPETSPAIPETTDHASALIKEDDAKKDIEAIEPCMVQSGHCTFDPNDDMFQSCLYTSMEDLHGQEITLYGFVYKDPSFPENTMVVARLYITCCVADASLVGYHIKVENTDDFAAETWIRVTGTIEIFSMEVDGEPYQYPIVSGGTIQKCETPQAGEAYLYP